MKKSRSSTLTRQQKLSILMATVNGFHSMAPLAPPVAAALADIPLARRITLDESWVTSFSRGGQVLDRLLFTTAYAYTTSVGSGGSASGETVDGYAQTVYDGGTVASTTVTGAGTQIVSGGTVNSTIIISGGSQDINGGTVTGTTIASGGTQTLHPGTSVTSTTVQSGGTLDLWGWGGSATATTLSAGYVLRADTSNTLTTTDGSVTISGGTASRVTLNSGGMLEVVFPGDKAISTTVNEGGSMYVDDGNVISTTVNGGSLNVYGGNVTSTMMNGGTMTVTYFGSGSVNATILNSGGSQLVNSGEVSATTVNSGGVQNVNGGTVIGTTVNSGGSQYVYGGTANETTLRGGEQFVFNGTAVSTTISGGRQIVSGGVASGTVINSGGLQGITSGGSATSTSVNAGGGQMVLSGGTAVSTIVNNSGEQAVGSGGTALGTIVQAGGLMNIDSGAQISGTTTLNGGTIALIGNSGSYAINYLVASSGNVRLAYSNTVGRNLTLNNLSGSANFIINTDLAAGAADTIIVSGGTSTNTLQVAYDPAYLTGQSITGSATFATVSGGSARFTAAASEYGAYSYTPTITSSTSGTTTTWTITQLAAASGASETVYTSTDTIAANLLLWRTENNNLAKRMGDLRTAGGEAGVWVRTYRGAQEIANSGSRATKQQYTALQGGYDRKISRNDSSLFTGYAIGYLEGSNTYNRGNGEASSFTAGVYGSWLGNKGHFLDVIAKVGKLRNSYTNHLNNPTNTKVDGSYSNWGTSLSAEYGYHKQLKQNWYLEPQAELTYSRINGASYSASDGTRLRNDAANSFTGRLGVALGRETGQTHYYGKVSLVREFSANAAVSAANGSLAPVTYRQNMKDTWLEFALGLTTKLDKRADGYLEITRTTGDKAKTPWQVNLGARWSL